MNTTINILFIVIIIAIIIIYYLISSKKLEHLTNQSDEAIQNLASLYNEDKLTIKDLNVTGNFNLLPKGVIVAWNGGVTPPAGWAVCNGQNGTPDLSERFILATTDAGNLEKYRSGGYWQIQFRLGKEHLPPHNHRITSSTSNE